MQLRIILRRLFQLKLNPIVIIISLATGLACINLIALFVVRELKTDAFHENSDRIFALTTNNPFQAGQKEYYCRYGSAEYISKNMAQVENFCKVSYSQCLRTVVNNNSYDDAPKLIAASPNFFNFFSYELLTKNPEKALESSDNVVISDELAKKYFGSYPPLGQIIRVVNGSNSTDLVVSGVFRRPQENTQLNFDMVRKIGDVDSPCFLLLSPEAQKEEVENLLAENLQTIPTMHDKDETTFYLSSLTETYFDPLTRSRVEVNRNKRDLWFALGIGFIILLIALVNYLGLVNNNVQEKRKECAIRLINGGSKSRLVRELMSENILYLGIAFLLSTAIMIWTFPVFNALVRTGLSAKAVFHPEQLGLLIGTTLLIALATYVFTYSRVKSENITQTFLVKRQPKSGSTSFSLFNVLQLTAAVILIISSMVIIKQIRYISTKPLGINKEVVEIKLPGAYRSALTVFRDELKKSALINMVTVVNTSPVLDHYLVKLYYEQNGQQKTYTPAGFEGDENYIQTLGIRILEGIDFNRSAPNEGKCLINQSLAGLFPGENLVGRKLPGSDQQIIGLVEDFHYNDLKQVVEPAVIWYNREGSYILAKPVSGREKEAMKYIESAWQKLLPDYPVNIESINDRYEWLHRENRKFVELITACCLISIFLSMIGLFAIAMDRSRRRIKEIGIRKVNGARVNEVIAMLNRDFITWVFVAIIIATPVAWFLMQNWLENYAYKTPLKWWIFAVAGLFALGITLITVSWQSWRTATRNPVEALKYE